MKEYFLVFCAIIALLYMIVAETVFGFRHPWMTDTERLVYIKSALMFRKVEYYEARPSHP